VSQNLDTTLAALSHHQRRDILERLSKGDLRIAEIAEPYDHSLNAVSKHIKVLEEAGLVIRHKTGREHFIHLNPEPFREVAQLVQFYSRFWMDRLDSLDALLKSTSPNDEQDESGT
tara:strand:- start:1727 stop:2074 length:348 start_codon:yes stop_codon:yes gene_type:complete